MLSTTKLFILIAIVFVLIFVFIIGFNPFSFAQPYINRELSSPKPSIATVIPSPSDYVILPAGSKIPDPSITTPEYTPVPIDR